MAEGNLFCDIQECGRVAFVFGLKGSSKEKFCESHALTLMRKGMAAYSIAAYRFIDSSEDVPIYEKRKACAELGLGNLTTLESSCETEMQEAQTRLENMKVKVVRVVERCFEEATMRVRNRFEEVQAQLSAVRQSLERFTQEKYAVLEDSEESLCKTMHAPPKFLRVAVADSSESVANSLLESVKFPVDSVHVAIGLLKESKRAEFLRVLVQKATEEAQQGKAAFALEALDYALLLGSKDSYEDIRTLARKQSQKSAQRLQQAFRFATDEPEVKRLVAEFYEKGKTEKAAFRYEESSAQLQCAWELLQSRPSNEAITVGLLLGEVLCLHLCQFSQAEAVFRRCLELSESCEEKMKCSNWVAAVYYYQRRYKDAEAASLWTMQTYSQQTVSADNWWTAAYYLASVYFWQSKEAELETFATQWISTPLSGESVQIQVLRLLMTGLLLHDKGPLHEAEKAFLEASLLCKKHFPTSIQAACSLHHLGRVQSFNGNLEEAEKTFLEGERILAVHYPSSFYAASICRRLGYVYDKMKQLSKAELKHLQAARIFSEHYLSTITAAMNYDELGWVYVHLKRIADAMGTLQKARNLFSAYHASTVEYANNLKILGALYADEHQWTEAIDVCSQACVVYMALSLRNDGYATCKSMLSASFEGLGRIQEAIEAMVEARNVWRELKSGDADTEAEPALARLRRALVSCK